MASAVMDVIKAADATGTIHIHAIKEICSAGLSECPPEDRCAAWLCLLGVFPPNPADWEARKKSMVDNYRDFVSVFKVEDWHTRTFPETVTPAAFPVDHSRAMAQIHGDIVRTWRHICFLPPEGKSDAGDNIEDMYEVPMRRLERILYVFACCSPSYSYLQGFSELIVPLYYVNVKAIDWLGGDIEMVEALTFRCFHELVIATQIHEFYTTAEDSQIVMMKMKQFDYLLELHLPEVFKMLESQDISPLQYCFRWFTVLFAQENQLPELLIIWDALFAHIDDLMEFVYYVGLAYIKGMQDELKGKEFTVFMQTLQNPQSDNIYTTLKEANAMYQMDKNPTVIDKMKRDFQDFAKKVRMNVPK